MQKVKIVNLKCGGCEATIKKGLEKIGMKNVVVDHEKSQVSFDGDLEMAKAKLAELGYPEADSKESKSLFKKARSFVSCATGKFVKK